MVQKHALGRGLSALIDAEPISTSGSSSINEIEIHKIHPNPHQPRTHFDEEALAELAASIKEIGIIQPITLRKIDEDNYEIIAGERRYRASKRVGLTTIPAYIKTADDDLVVEMALIENLQREDLNAIEIALTFQRLQEEYKMTQERLSERVGKKRATVANYLRLLRLPAEIQMAIKDKQIDMGHARAIITIDDPARQLGIYEQIIKNHLSVRKVEELVRNIDEVRDNETKNQHPIPKEHVQIEKQLKEHFGVPVKFICNDKGKGKITLSFRSDEELEKLMELFDKLH
ncbi:ParB/RepB/Spo0J family partition protein [Microbacter margulisiae]|uniref:ParB family chromosome partitioning protein n=1 Tax=Microbacter margulisiae TaxID=1350067 RepID=A0A7W5DQM4_9PORP|nr:ParB/RepB/Spo0J family partition protein [Microbacter margulisiae]MBB3186774.1 ParB family chromosome partitioning protein [Microbacter margulisiae]